MDSLPKYAETIIVDVKFKSIFNWYVSDKELWYLDLADTGIRKKRLTYS
jgi:hypothetical protein